MRQRLIATTALAGLCFAPHLVFAQTSGLPQSSVPGASSPSAPSITPPISTSPEATSTQAGSPSVQEVVVTAQRRSENLQNVPIAVTAITAAQLSRAGVSDTQSLAAVTPGLTFPSGEGYALPHIRGVGISAEIPGDENSVALYVDGVYYASAAGSILSLNNVSRVEVLKGPQGTLFGRNATGGLIQVVTRDPTYDPHLESSFSYGNYDTSTLDFYATTGLTSNLAADIAVQASHQGDGYGHDLATGKDDYKLDSNLSARTKLLWRPQNGTRVELSLDFEDTRTSIGGTQVEADAVSRDPYYPPSVITTKPYDLNQDLQPLILLYGGGAALHVTQELGFADLVSITAYRRQRFDLTVDFDEGPQPYSGALVNQFDNQVSQELQLQSHDSGPFRWTTGFFYFHAGDGYNPLQTYFNGLGAIPIAPGVDLTGVNVFAEQKDSSEALYAQASYEFLPHYTLTGGIRFTHEERDFAATQPATLNGVIPINLGNASGSLTVNKPTWRVSLDHNFTPDVLGYASYNRGFKSGGFNISDPAAGAYKTEQLDAYEIGLKTRLLDHRLRLNFAAFYYNYSNIQISLFQNGLPIVYNGASADIYGIDVDMDAVLTRNLSLNVGLEGLHDNFDSFPCADYFAGGAMLSSPACSTSGVPSLPYQRSAAGHALPDAPNFTSSLTLDYHHDMRGGKADASVTNSFNSGYYYEPNNDPLVHQSSFDVVNTSVSWSPPDDRYTIRLWAKNLFDNRYTMELASSAVGLGEAFAPPRTYGFTLALKL